VADLALSETHVIDRRCAARTATGSRCKRRSPEWACHLHDGRDGIGRPACLTLSVQALVVDALREGASLRQAAQRAGVSRATLYRWRARGLEEGAPERFQKLVREVAAVLGTEW
jgi:hypothetical protein